MSKVSIYLAKLYTSVAFYLGWFVCIFGATHGSNVLPIVSTIVLLAIQFHIFSSLKIYNSPFRDFPLLFFVTLFGGFIDTLYIYLGLIEYSATIPGLPWLCPPWVLCMYALFSSTINHSLSWLRKFPLLSAVLGAVFSFLSYVAGAKVGAATFLAPGFTTPTLIGLVWFFFLPMVMYFSRPHGPPMIQK